MSDWQDISTAPKDGSSFDVEFQSTTGLIVVVSKLHYGHDPTDKTKMILWGNCNFLSPLPDLTPLRWHLPSPPEET
jgi:hypothetical protein